MLCGAHPGENVNRRITRFALVAMVVAGAQLHAQTTGSIGGTVLRDTLGHAIAGSEIFLPGLNRSARANASGDFRIDGVPPGKQAIIVRHVGFDPLIDSVLVTAGQVFEADFILSERVVTLDSQRVEAPSLGDEPNLREFEERRKLGVGHFVDKAELRKIEGGRSLINYLGGHIPGLSVYRPDPRNRQTDYYLSSGRGATISHTSFCPVQIYMDGVPFIMPKSTADTPDISDLTADDYSGIEYYPASMAPPEYNKTGSGCGVLLFWRRYKR
jgi:hypothetical protein